MRQHCNRCGGFVTPAPENRSLLMTRAGLPLPPAGNPFFGAIRESQKREAEARRRGVTRQIGAERRARFELTTNALRGAK